MSGKVCDQKEAVQRVQAAKNSGKTVVFTNGCFDLLHGGHVRYLQAAREQGDLLIVGLNSDRSVTSIKGPKRPIMPQDQRAEVLSALACVDIVTLFDEDTPLALIQAVLPHVLVKGADWAEEAIVGADVVKQAGGKVVRVALEPGASTSAIIQTILDHYAAKGD